MKRLVCEKCGNDEFYFAYGMTYTVYVLNGNAGGRDYYACSKCGHQMGVERRAVQELTTPQIVFIPEDTNK